MDKSIEDNIAITAMMKRYSEQRLPKALELEKKVLAGNTLDESELDFLALVFKDAQYVLRLSDKFPEYQELVSKAIQLYSDITAKALENEKLKGK